jgi:phosphoribosyl-dephospho-CoA transferase
MDAIGPFRPHDLLFLRRLDAFDASPAGAALPDWLDAAWLDRAPLVVRRASTGAGRIAVGARGLLRSQRCAGQVDASAVARSVTPEMLAQSVLSAPARFADGAALPCAALPCIAALLRLAPRLQDLGLAWGPAGGTGFWLASGLAVLGPGSDLDLLVRAPRPLAPALAQALLALQADAACRLDIQVDTGAGGFALAEYARGARVLLKTAGGPLLLDDPWEADPWDAHAVCNPREAA